MNRPLRRLTLSAALLAGAVPAAHAAESYDNCTGFIDTVPATVSTQGTWCLRGHRFTSQTTGAAITIGADNVTIDCNDFRISGLGAGAATEAVGISAGSSRQNATVRNCRVQGFKRGTVLFGGGHVVEDNHFDLNTYSGIYVTGDSIVRGNSVTDTGGRPGTTVADAIIAIGDGPGVQVLDNAIRGVVPVGDGGGNRSPRGIYADNAMVQGNRVSGLVPGGGFGAVGIALLDGIARDNVLTQSATSGIGISGVSAVTTLCQDNTVQGYTTGIDGCQLAGANGTQP